MPKSKKQLALAACSFEVQAKDGRIQLLPYGEFRAVDGRPTDAPAWYLTEENGRDVADLANAARNQLVVDYEHQTLHKERNGQPAPAAGWMRWLEFTPKGLFADVEWTEKAAAAIAAKEYRYVSAVFSYDTKGFVRKIFHAALTNYPALDGMDEVLAAASAGFGHNPNPTEPKPMNQLLQQLFGLPATATEQELTAALSALLAAKPEGAVLSADVFKDLADKEQALAALSVQTAPDLTKYAPIEVVQALQNQVAALTAERESDKGEKLITAALAAGKLLPAQKAWAEGVLKQPGGLAFLSGFIESAQPVAALTGTQTDGAKPEERTAALTAEEAAAAKMLGMSHAEFMKIKEEKDQ
ncbi:phage protease [Bergeriella denitrificans]|uniref:Protein gp32 n=1 Tax=Bergeriella denitrificans TaxID=494 RepID=A0A378UGS5_BERDE|nr:phage protease [Bergeriella denitrificans]STZ76330.1 protein gp32 [Bergeriella denitrificans]